MQHIHFKLFNRGAFLCLWSISDMTREHAAAKAVSDYKKGMKIGDHHHITAHETEL